MIKKNKKPKDSPDETRFSEQYRFVFSATIIATFYVAPSGNALEAFLKWILGFAMSAAALYIVCTAATMKYHNARWMYEVFYVSERIRKWAYDIAVDIFAAGFLFFIGILVTGLAENLLNVRFNSLVMWIVLFISTLAIGLGIGFISKLLKDIDERQGVQEHL